MGLQEALAVIFNRIGNYWIINDGHHFFQVLAHQIKEQGPIGVENSHQEVALFNAGLFSLKLGIDFRRLFLNRPDLRRQRP